MSRTGEIAVRSSLLVPVLGIFLLFATYSTGSHKSRIPHSGITATIFPMKALTEELLGEDEKIPSIVLPGADLHHYSLSPANTKALMEADILIACGGEIDAYIYHFARTINPKIKIIEAQRDEETGNESRFHYNQDSLTDSHPWLIPRKAIEMEKVIESALIRAFPQSEPDFLIGGSELRRELREFNAGAKDALRIVRNAPFVSLDPSFSFFFKEYGLREIAVIKPSPDSPLLPSRLLQIKEEIRKEGARVLFYTETAPESEVKSLREITGLPAVQLNKMENPPASKGYLEITESNIRLIRQGLLIFEALR